MLDSKILRKNIQEIAENLAQKKYILDIDYFIKIDNERKNIIAETEDLKNKKNKISKNIGILKAKGNPINDLSSEVEEINKILENKKQQLNKAENEFKSFLLGIPNTLDKNVPKGKSENENTVIKYSNDINLENEAKEDILDHSEIAKKLNFYDQDIASEISGTRFSLMFNKLAKLNRALGSFMLDIHINENKYIEVNVPLIVNSNSLIGTGQLPKFKDDLFEIKNKDNFFLIPTAEVPLTNIFRNKILNEEEFPILYTSLSTCFRSEAGSYGKDTKGLIRQHQFDKVELVNIVKPDESDKYLSYLISHAEKILELLKLPYRKVLLCSGDTGFSAAITYDLEVWMPSQNKYREISSCSNFKDFQSRRLNIKYIDKNSNKKEYVHTLNGSGLAIGRTIAAILENYQDVEGKIKIPEALRPYMNDEKYLNV